MFRVSTTPIIRNTQNCNYSLWYWSYFLCRYIPLKWPSLATLEGGSGTVPEVVVTVLCTPDDRCWTELNNPCNITVRWYSFTNIMTNSFRQRGLLAESWCIMWCRILILILLTWRIWWAPNNASKWQMRFNSAFKRLSYHVHIFVLCFVQL